ncbi:MAG: amidohydrolase family protein [Rhodospirillaceae bacterium]|nr:amidohydrolase family protein [Rhodospirillaceae bacterium]
MQMGSNQGLGAAAGPSRLNFVPPAGSCDAQFHAFGSHPAERADPNAPYHASNAPIEEILAAHRRLGLDNGVLVQNTSVSMDYGPFLHDLATYPQLRGIALIGDDTAARDLQRLHDGGVRGTRFHFVRFLRRPCSPEMIRRAAERIADMGWHIKVHVQPDQVAELAPFLVTLPVPIVVDHIAHTRIADGIDHPSFKALLELYRHPNIWVLLANSDRWSPSGPPAYADAIPFGRALVEADSERLLWATDWPHVMYKDPQAQDPSLPRPDPADLLNLLHAFAPDEAVLRKILVTNPRKLFPFS